MKTCVILFVLLFIFLNSLQGDDINLSAQKDKKQDENCFVKDNVDQPESFLKLSDEAKKIVFDQLLNLTFFPEKESKVFHYSSGFSAEVFKNDKLFSESTRFYREGILAGYFYAFYYLNEDKWKKILDTDNENEFQKFVAEISGNLHSPCLTAGASQYLTSFDIDRNVKNHSYDYLYWGFIKGRKHAELLQIKAIQEIKDIRKKIGNKSRISNDQNKTKPDQEKDSVILPTIEALLFLKKEFTAKIQVDKLVIEEVIKKIENGDYPN
jgi:hypothetical protein